MKTSIDHRDQFFSLFSFPSFAVHSVCFEVLNPLILQVTIKTLVWHFEVFMWYNFFFHLEVFLPK